MSWTGSFRVFTVCVFVDGLTHSGLFTKVDETLPPVRWVVYFLEAESLRRTERVPVCRLPTVSNSVLTTTFWEVGSVPSPRSPE